jgi:hypothetical protein
MGSKRKTHSRTQRDVVERDIDKSDVVEGDAVESSACQVVEAPEQVDLNKLLASLRQLDQFQPEIEAKAEVTTPDHANRLADVERRLQAIERKVTDLSNYLPQLEQAVRNQSMAQPVFTDVGSKARDDEPGESDNSTGLSTMAFLSNWEAERAKMLNAIEDETKTPEAVEEVISSTTAIDKTLVDLEDMPGVTAEDINEIAALKQRLQEMLRETEIELSIQRAKISHERAQIEQKAAIISQRERELSRRVEEGKKNKGVLSRMKNFLQMNTEVSKD